jgi:hypothetical protein
MCFLTVGRVRGLGTGLALEIQRLVAAVSRHDPEGGVPVSEVLGQRATDLGFAGGSKATRLLLPSGTGTPKATPVGSLGSV